MGGKSWVEPLATSKLLHSSHSHIKGKSTLKACWADMPCVCWGEHWYVMVQGSIQRGWGF